ncbi:MAG TPA: hypothetical protein VGM23_00415, partial [Armatimonadota bacterium]
MRTVSSICLWCLLCLLTPALGADALSWQIGKGTREVENGAVLENDLVFVQGNGQGNPRYYPQAAVVQYGPLPGTQPGRYRVTLRARTSQWGGSNLVLQAWVRQSDGGAGQGTGYGWIPTPTAVTPMSGYYFANAGQWQQFTLDFDIEAGKPTMVGVMYVGDKTSPPAGAIQVEKASLKVEHIALPVSISWARPVKVRYKHDEQAALEFRLTNATDRAQEVAVRPVVINDREERYPAAGKKITVPPLATISAQTPFPVPADGGYEADGELLIGGKVIDRKGDVFTVSDSPFQCMLQGGGEFPGFLSWSGGQKGFNELVVGHWDDYVRQCTEFAERSRREYANYREYFAWAREDATLLVENTDDTYLAGQCSWPVSRKQLLLLNGLLRRQGIAPVAYVNAIPFGWPGFEVIRQYPEWYGGGANFDTALLERYQRNEPAGTYPCIPMKFDAVSPAYGKRYLDYHIDQLTASAKLYGWEAYRYDAGPLPLQYFPEVKQMLAKLKPPVYIGNNEGIACLGPQQSEAWKVYCEQGSLMMEEAIGGAWHSATSPYRRWTDWIDFLRRGAHLTRGNGGHYTYINGNSNTWYSAALGYAVGGHPWGFIKSPFGDNERFMT